MKKQLYLLFSFICAFFAVTSSVTAIMSNSYAEIDSIPLESLPLSSTNSMLQRYSFSGDETILTIGSGTTAAYLATQLTDGSVTGIDNSPAKIDFAQKNYDSMDNLEFLLKDVSQLDLKQKFDVAVSFTTFQFVQDQFAALQSIRNSLKPLGHVLIQIPTIPNTMTAAIQDTILNEKWQHYFIGFNPKWRSYYPGEYQALLKDAGLQPLRVELVTYEDVFASKKDFMNYVGQWLPYLQPLPEHLKDSFLTTVVNRYLELMPEDTQGQIYFMADRLEAEAVNPNLS